MNFPVPMRFASGLLTVFLLWGQSASTFINIESLRQGLSEGFAGSSGVEAMGSSGNTNVFEAGLNTRNIFKHGQREYIFIATYDYGEASDLKNSNKGNGHIRYSQGFSRSSQWEIFGQVEFNEFQSLELRSLVGFGLRQALFKGTKNSLFIGLGAFYEDETLKIPPDQSNFRANFYLSFRSLIKEDMEFVMVTYYQPNTEVISDERLQMTAGLEIEILNQLSLVSSWSFSRDARPPVGILKEDASYKVGVNFSY